MKKQNHSLCHLTELPLPSVVFGLDIWDCDQLLSYLRFIERHFLLSLYYFVLDFYEQVSLVLFPVHQPFHLLSSLFSPMGVFRSWTLTKYCFQSCVDPILITGSFLNALRHPCICQQQIFVYCFFPWLSVPCTAHCRHSTSDSVFVLRFSYFAAISSSLLHLTLSNIWRADLPLKSVWLTLSGNSLVPL